MNLTVADFRELIRAESASLLAQLDRLTENQWATASPCTAWDVLGVLVHMQLGTWVHTGMVANALAGRTEPPWTLPEGADAHETFVRVQRETHAEGPAANLARFRERLARYDETLADASDDALDRPAWFYGLPADLRRVVSAYVNDLIVHATDIRRPLGLEPWFSPAGARFAGQATLPYLPMFVAADRLAGASGIVRQMIDGVTSIVALGPAGLEVASENTVSDGGSQAAGESASATPNAELVADGGTWTLLVWRQLPPADAERRGRLRISGDRALVERYLTAIKTP